MIHLYLCSKTPPPNIVLGKPFIVITTYGIVRNCNPNPIQRKGKQKKNKNLPDFLFKENQWRRIFTDEIHIIRNQGRDVHDSVIKLVTSQLVSFKTTGKKKLWI
jgi:hypothetical protein